jgi:hypothetical protein
MTNDSMTQLVRYQRTTGALPEGPGFSVRTNWAGPLSGLGGSVRKYVGDYKGVTTYIKLVGLQGVTTNIIGRQGVTEGIGVMAGLLNGANADDPSQSASWNAIMVAVQNAYNTARAESDQTASALIRWRCSQRTGAGGLDSRCSDCALMVRDTESPCSGSVLRLPQAP